MNAYPAEQMLPPPSLGNAPAISSGRGRVWFVLTGILAVLSGVVPLAKGSSGTLFDSGATFIVPVLVIAAVALIAATQLGSSVAAAGFGGGACLALATTYGCLSLLLWTLLDGQGLELGFAVMVATAVCGVVAFLTSFRTGSNKQPVHGFVRLIGVVGTLAMSLGCTLVPSDYGSTSWSDYNYFGEFSDLKFALALQAIVWAPCLAGLIGFSSGTRWGIGMATGGSLLVAWLLLYTAESSLDGGGSFDALFRNEIHPVAYVGLAVTALAVVIGLIQTSIQTAMPTVAAMPPAPVQYTPAASPFVAPLPVVPIASFGSTGPPMPTVPLPRVTMPLPAVALQPPQWSPIQRSIEETVARPGYAIHLSNGAVLALRRDVVIGRDPAPATEFDVVAVADPLLSRSQVRLSVSNGLVLAEDLMSTNGSSIQIANGAHRALVPGSPTPVSVGDRILFGESWGELRR